MDAIKCSVTVSIGDEIIGVSNFNLLSSCELILTSLRVSISLYFSFDIVPLKHGSYSVQGKVGVWVDYKNITDLFHSPEFLTHLESKLMEGKG